MSATRPALRSPRAWVSAALSLTVVLTSVFFDLMWDAFLMPFKPVRLLAVVAATAAAALWLWRWSTACFNQPKRPPSYWVPFAIGSVLLPASGIGAFDPNAAPAIEDGIRGAGEMLLQGVELVTSAAVGGLFAIWARSMIHAVWRTEERATRTTALAVGASIARGSLALGVLLVTVYLVLLGFAERLPEFTVFLVVTCVWAALALAAAVALGWLKAQDR